MMKVGLLFPYPANWVAGRVSGVMLKVQPFVEPAMCRPLMLALVTCAACSASADVVLESQQRSVSAQAYLGSLGADTTTGAGSFDRVYHSESHSGQAHELSALDASIHSLVSASFISFNTSQASVDEVGDGFVGGGTASAIMDVTFTAQAGQRYDFFASSAYTTDNGNTVNRWLGSLESTSGQTIFTLDPSFNLTQGYGGELAQGEYHLHLELWLTQGGFGVGHASREVFANLTVPGPGVLALLAGAGFVRRRRL